MKFFSNLWNRLPNWGKVTGVIITMLTIYGGFKDVGVDFFGASSNLEVTSINVDCNRPDGNCLLDFTVINNGKGTVMIEYVTLTVTGIDNLNSIVRSSVNGDDTVNISELYRPGDKAQCHIRMEVPPTKVEAFSILLRATKDGYTERRWQFRVTLETSDGDLPIGVLPKEIVL